MKKTGIYKIVNKINNKTYIGSSIDIDNRFYVHKNKLKKNIHPNNILQNSVNKYGIENFIFEVIEECDVELLTEREQYWINFNINGYNIRKIAESNRGISLSEETKKKISESNKGKVISEHVRKLLSKAHKGRPKSKESVEKMKKSLTNRKLSEEHKKNISKNHANKNKSLPEKTKKKISENHKLKNIKPPSRLGSKVPYKPRPNVDRSGEKNPMFGKAVKDVWIEKYGLEIANKKWCERFPKKCGQL